MISMIRLIPNDATGLSKIQIVCYSVVSTTARPRLIR